MMENEGNFKFKPGEKRRYVYSFEITTHADNIVEATEQFWKRITECMKDDTFIDASRWNLEIYPE